MGHGKAARSALLPFLLLLLPLLDGCATIPYDYPHTPSIALYLPEATSMGKKIQAQVKANGRSQSDNYATRSWASEARALPRLMSGTIFNSSAVTPSRSTS